MEFLRSFLRPPLAGKPVVASPNVGCFLRLVERMLQKRGTGNGNMKMGAKPNFNPVQDPIFHFPVITGLTNVAIFCACFSECAPSTSFHLLRLNEEVFTVEGLKRSGFVCHKCRLTMLWRCYNCSLCPVGYHVSDISTNAYVYGSCQACPAGNFNGVI